jgi:hypothetical protein
MSVKMRITETVTLGGVTLTMNKVLTTDKAVIVSPTDGAAVAIAANLSVRTNNSNGTLTFANGTVASFIGSGKRLDLKWANGTRVGEAGGTVSGANIPITLGNGDNLPVLGTTINVSVPHLETATLSGDDIIGFAAGSDQPGSVVFTNDSGVYLTHKSFLTGPWEWSWFEGNGDDNPFTGLSIGRIYLSNYDLSSVAAVAAVAVGDSF